MSATSRRISTRHSSNTGSAAPSVSRKYCWSCEARLSAAAADLSTSSTTPMPCPLRQYTAPPAPSSRPELAPESPLSPVGALSKNQLAEILHGIVTQHSTPTCAAYTHPQRLLEGWRPVPDFQQGATSYPSRSLTLSASDTQRNPAPQPPWAGDHSIDVSPARSDGPPAEVRDTPLTGSDRRQVSAGGIADEVRVGALRSSRLHSSSPTDV